MLSMKPDPMLPPAIRLVDAAFLEPEPAGACCVCGQDGLHRDSPTALCDHCQTIVEKFYELVSRLYTQCAQWDPDDPEEERCDPGCPSWGFFLTGSGYEIERCDSCANIADLPLFQWDDEAGELVVWCIHEAMRVAEILRHS